MASLASSARHVLLPRRYTRRGTERRRALIAGSNEETHDRYRKRVCVYSLMYIFILSGVLFPSVLMSQSCSSKSVLIIWKVWTSLYLKMFLLLLLLLLCNLTWSQNHSRQMSRKPSLRYCSSLEMQQCSLLVILLICLKIVVRVTEEDVITPKGPKHHAKRHERPAER